MGTNFYWLTTTAGPCATCGHRPPKLLPDGVEVEHVGKRSAAGMWCWDCNLTLCEQGSAHIHSGHGTMSPVCLRCGKGPAEEGLRNSSAGVELGFAQPATERKTGVASCSSWAWAQDPALVRSICETSGDRPVIRDEYGRVLTGREFLRMLKANCPWERMEMIGREFS